MLYSRPFVTPLRLSILYFCVDVFVLISSNLPYFYAVRVLAPVCNTLETEHTLLLH